MAETKTYTGSCHCGKVRYEVTMALESLGECNCSICSRAGYRMTFVKADQFKLLSGEDALTDYQFNKHNIHHWFCATCGIRSFGSGTGPDGEKMHMINARCLADVDIDAFELKKYDGKRL
ncbi:MAG TPA: GFA family protein [Polyangiaceae bacterium]